MKTLTLAAIAILVGVQPVLASVTQRIPDGGSTVLLALISLGGLIAGKNLMKRR